MKRGDICIPVALIFLLLFACVLLLVPSTYARMGYDITATVGSSSLAIHRSTQEFLFMSKDLIKGSGNFSKYSHIEGFAGVKYDELTSTTKPSKLEYGEQTLLRSREGPVQITINAESGFNESEDEIINLTDSAEIHIIEYWPTYFAQTKKIKYFGEGIRNRERYENNGGVVSNSIQSWKLSKESLFSARINNTIINAYITPTSKELNQFMNSTTRYNLNVDSIGSNTHIDVSRHRSSSDLEAFYSQDYGGEQKILLEMLMTDTVRQPINSSYGWLGNCSATCDPTIDLDFGKS
jgi:hypothetical protein